MRFFRWLLPIFVLLDGYAADDELQQLRRQIETLGNRLDALEHNRSTAAVSEQTAKAMMITDDAAGHKPPMEQKGALELAGESTVLSVGGRIQLHAVYAWPKGLPYAANIPLDTTGEEGQLIMSARDSRLWVKTRTRTPYDLVRTLIEIDFLGTTGNEATYNSHGLRLRHAYLEASSLTVGQTNSAFNAYVTLDTILDAINKTEVRQPLIMYGFAYRKWSVDFSAEQPEATLLDPSGEIIAPKDDILPDFITRIRYFPKWGEASASFMGRYLNQDCAELSNGTVVQSSDSAVGWGVNVSGKIRLFTYDDIRFDIQCGEGLGRYTARNAFAAGFIDNDGTITLQPTFGGHLGYRRWWDERWRSTFALAYAGTDNRTEAIDPDGKEKVTKAMHAFYANLLWMPMPNALIGAEYVKARRRVESGAHGNMDTLLLLLRYNF